MSHLSGSSSGSATRGGGAVRGSGSGSFCASGAASGSGSACCARCCGTRLNCHQTVTPAATANRTPNVSRTTRFRTTASSVTVGFLPEATSQIACPFEILSMTIRAALFDFDGTLADSFAAITASTNHVRESYGLPPLPEAEVRQYVGHGLAHLMR